MKKLNLSILKASIVLFSSISIFSSCSESKSKEKESNKALALPVYTVNKEDAVTVKDYLGTIEGKVNVESVRRWKAFTGNLRDEGGFCAKRAKALFKIDPFFLPRGPE